MLNNKINTTFVSYEVFVFLLRIVQKNSVIKLSHLSKKELIKA
jgi:hypothetical protein